LGLKDNFTPEGYPHKKNKKEFWIHLLENAEATAFGKTFKVFFKFFLKKPLLQSKKKL